MTAKKRGERSPSSTAQGRFELLLEEIRGQNAVTIEAVDGARRDLKADNALLDERIRTVESVVRQNGADIRQNSADIRQNSADIVDLRRTVEDLSSKMGTKADRADLLAMERRVSVLEAGRR